MKNIFNWATICYLLVLFYLILSSIFPVIPLIPFGQWGVLQSLAVIAVAIIGKDVLDTKIVAQQIYNGDYLSVPAILDGLQKTNKRVYEKVLRDYKDIINDRMSEAQTTIDETRKRIRKNWENGLCTSFSITEEMKTVRNCENIKSIITEIENGTKSWADVHKTIIDNERLFAMLKLLLNEGNDDITTQAKVEAEKIQEARKNGLKVIVGE